MPVDAGRLGQVVGDVDAHPVALGDADARPRNLAVEGVGLTCSSGRMFHSMTETSRSKTFTPFSIAARAAGRHARRRARCS